MPVATCRCRATETPRSTPRRASARPASVASLPARTGPASPSSSPPPRAPATSTSCQSGRVGCTIWPALTGEGTATPTPTTRSPNSRWRIFSRAATSASIPVPETASRSWRSSTVQRPVSSKAAMVNESSRRSTASATGPCGCAEGTPVGRPRVRGTLSPAGRVGRAAQLLDELTSGQVPDQHGSGPPGQAELPGQLGPGELAAAVVDRAQQPREIVRAQLGARGRRSFVLPHTPIVPCLAPSRRAALSAQGYQSQWKPTAVFSASRR